MSHLAHKTDSAPQVRIERARILEPGCGANQYRVRLEREGGEVTADATLAMPVAPPMALGFEVLVVDGGEELFIIGLVPPAEGAPAAGLRLQSGEEALVRRGPDGETLELRNADGELLFSYDGAEGRARLCVAKGDLDLVAEQGSINLSAAHAMRFTAPLGVDISTGTAGARSGIDIKPGLVQFVTPHLSMLAKRAGVHVEEMQYSADKLRAALARANVVAERVEITADVVAQKARNVYQTVEGVWHSKVGRVRQLVKEAYQIKSKTFRLKTDDEIFIDGRSINLG